MSSCTIIAIAGGSGSGKTTLARKLHLFLARHGCCVIGQDSYYRDQSARFDHDGGAVNFDHPDALEFTLMATHLTRLKMGRPVEIPIYDFATHKRMAKSETLHPHRYIIVDGILVLSQDHLLPLFDEAIFLEVDETTRFERRMTRDILERGRTREGVHEQFFKQVKPMHDQFVEPSKHSCTLLVKDGHQIISQKRNSPVHDQLRQWVSTLMVKSGS